MVRARPRNTPASAGDIPTTADPTGTGRQTGPTRRLPRLLAWFSAGLGAAELVAPDRVARLAGIPQRDDNHRILRAMGVRELSVVPGLLSRPRPAGWLGLRVAGDLLDLALLDAAMGQRRSDHRRLRAAKAAVAAVTAVDLLAALRTSRSADPTTRRGHIRVKAAVTVNRSPGDVYGFWRQLENLPAFMAHLEAVEVHGGGRSRWVAAAPGRRRVEWEAEITEDLPGQRIAWRSLPGAQVPNHGSITFAAAPGGAGTEVVVELEHRPPGRALGAAVARLFGEDPEQQVRDDLRRLKQLLETGEVVRSDGSPDGSHTVAQRHHQQRPAQPAA